MTNNKLALKLVPTQGQLILLLHKKIIFITKYQFNITEYNAFIKMKQKKLINMVVYNY